MIPGKLGRRDRAMSLQESEPQFTLGRFTRYVSLYHCGVYP